MPLRVRICYYYFDRRIRGGRGLHFWPGFDGLAQGTLTTSLFPGFDEGSAGEELQDPAGEFPLLGAAQQAAPGCKDFHEGAGALPHLCQTDFQRGHANLSGNPEPLPGKDGRRKEQRHHFHGRALHGLRVQQGGGSMHMGFEFPEKEFLLPPGGVEGDEDGGRMLCRIQQRGPETDGARRGFAFDVDGGQDFPQDQTSGFFPGGGIGDRHADQPGAVAEPPLPPHFEVVLYPDKEVAAVLLEGRPQFPKQPWGAVEAVRQQQGVTGDGGDEIAGEGEFAVVLPAQGDGEGAVGAQFHQDGAQQVGIGAGGAAFAGAGFAGVGVDGSSVAQIEAHAVDGGQPQALVEALRMQGRVGQRLEHVWQQAGQQFPAEGGFAQAQGRIREGNTGEHKDMVGEGSRPCQCVVNQSHEPVKMIELGPAGPARPQQRKDPGDGAWRHQPREGNPEITGKNREGGGAGSHTPLKDNSF